MRSFATTLVTSLLFFSAVASAIPGVHGSGRMHRLRKSSIRKRATGGKSLRCGAGRTSPEVSTLGSTAVSTSSSSTLAAATETTPLAIATIATISTLALTPETPSTVPQVPGATPTTVATLDIFPTTLQRELPVISSPIEEVPSVPQVTQVTPSPPSGGLSAEAIESLQWHNVVRRQHNAVDLTWSDELASAAQQWASQCAFKHSGGSLGPFGENLAAGTSSSYSVQNAVTAWTDEVVDYNPGSPQASHYTQVVWRGTTQVGCAMVSGCQGIFPGASARYYVCEYSPAGNVFGRFAENVQ